MTDFQTVNIVPSIDNTHTFDVNMSDGNTQLFRIDSINKWVVVGQDPIGGNQDPNILLYVSGNQNNYFGINVTNYSTGVNSSADIVVLNDASTSNAGWIDMGITSSAYNNPTYGIQTANEGYLFCISNNLLIGTGGTGNSGNIYFFTGGVTNNTYIKLTISSGGVFTYKDGVNFVFGTTTGTKIGVTGGSGGEKIGFWGKTPIIQPILATGAGKNSDDIITVLQNLGLVRQS